MQRFVANRRGIPLAVLLEEAASSRGLAVVVHEMGGFKEQPHIAALARAAREAGYAVLRYDASNSLGESGGRIEEARFGGYREDLEDMVRWAKEESGFSSPFVLLGHSMGGLCCALYAEEHPDEVRALGLLAPVVSGLLAFEAWEQKEPERIAEWRRTGWLHQPSRTRPGIIKRHPWEYMEESWRHDALAPAERLRMPLLALAGGGDLWTPAEHVVQLVERASGPREMVVIPEATHTFRDPAHLAEAERLLGEWLERLPPRGGSSESAPSAP